MSFLANRFLGLLCICCLLVLSTTQNCLACPLDTTSDCCEEELHVNGESHSGAVPLCDCQLCFLSDKSTAPVLFQSDNAEPESHLIALPQPEVFLAIVPIALTESAYDSISHPSIFWPAINERGPPAQKVFKQKLCV
jgi:hypothetical protein